MNRVCSAVGEFTFTLKYFIHGDKTLRTADADHRDGADSGRRCQSNYRIIIGLHKFFRDNCKKSSSNGGTKLRQLTVTLKREKRGTPERYYYELVIF